MPPLDINFFVLAEGRECSLLSTSQGQREVKWNWQAIAEWLWEVRLATRMRNFMMMALVQPEVGISKFLDLGEKEILGADRGAKGPFGGNFCAGIIILVCGGRSNNFFPILKILFLPARMPCWWLLRASCHPASSISLGLDPHSRPCSLPVRPTVR